MHFSLIHFPAFPHFVVKLEEKGQHFPNYRIFLSTHTHVKKGKRCLVFQATAPLLPENYPPNNFNCNFPLLPLTLLVDSTTQDYLFRCENLYGNIPLRPCMPPPQKKKKVIQEYVKLPVLYGSFLRDLASANYHLSTHCMDDMYLIANLMNCHFCNRTLCCELSHGRICEGFIKNQWGSSITFLFCYYVLWKNFQANTLSKYLYYMVMFFFLHIFQKYDGLQIYLKPD